ncbi:hypothetical protein THAOC_34442 [Thalassiosira oceanica]|uniref:DUF3641 domain-containing protein n=1 Tax=Thalassiosira oceanica TaxID=159749 RepID=K0RJK9_THAOC|nr:hypothetical protein THAOC_34442 [Thalassiosira oceanica]|eukprot:EJK46872.1 hypothetical protein THAOC_34442 [Thalassiosira oceanica]
MESMSHRRASDGRVGEGELVGEFGVAAAGGADAFTSSRYPRHRGTSCLEATVTDDANPNASLIETTLAEMESDAEFQELTEKIARIGVDGMTKEERTQRRRALDELGVPNFMTFVAEHEDRTGPGDESTASPIRNKKLFRSDPNILQLNIGLFCNQACNHCHVESSPLRKETMSSEVAARCLRLLQNSPHVDTLDLTGGAPELNAEFRFLVRMAREWAVENDRELTIIDRCNLTVLSEPGQEDLAEFLKDNRVDVVASLPCYGEENVDNQRGRGVFGRSIDGLLKLNEAGYGTAEGLSLTLVYNPGGPFLPPSQSSLEADYKRELDEKFGVKFNNLLTITNMPIKRFADFLAREGKMKEYMELLVNNYNPETVPGLMCLNTISVGWDGTLYDCDFNQQLGMDIQKLSVFDIECLTDLQKYSVKTDNHCFGCSAGAGSSCQGATV